MGKLVCEECGKRYDYHTTEFCPRCGAYNRPQDRAISHLEPGPLFRARGQESSQARPGGKVTFMQKATTVTRRPPQVRWQGGKVILFVVLLVAAVLAINTLLVGFLSGGLPSFGAVPEAPLPERADGVVRIESYKLEEEFPLNDVLVTVDGAWRLQGEDADQQYLLLDVWITGGSRQKDLKIADPYLQLPGGEQVWIEDDAKLAARLGKEYGIYAVTLRDYQWEDPLYGQFVFALPEGEGAGALLVLEEYAPGDTSGLPQTIRQVELELQ